jgi:hypothetical protein
LRTQFNPTKRPKSPSIIDAGFHCTYPTRLRSTGTYHRRSSIKNCDFAQEMSKNGQKYSKGSFGWRRNGTPRRECAVHQKCNEKGKVNQQRTHSDKNKNNCSRFPPTDAHEEACMFQCLNYKQKCAVAEITNSICMYRPRFVRYHHKNAVPVTRAV